MIQIFCSLLLSGLLSSLPAGAQSKPAEPAKASLPKSQITKLEDRLRERVDGLYTAIKNSQWRKVESFLNDDAKIAWAPERKMAIYGFEIKSVEVSPDGKSGVTEVVMDQPVNIPGFPLMTRTHLPQTVQWAWENDDWYALIGGPHAPPDLNPPRITPPENPANTDLEFTNDPYDFRLVRQGETIKATFYFTNKSDHLVKAKAKIFNPCACVTAKIMKDGAKPSADGWMEFKPGEDGRIDVTMETKAFAGYLAQGLDVEMQPSGVIKSLQMTGTVVSGNQIIPK